MKTLEFDATLNADSSLRVPQELAAQIPQKQVVRVIVLLGDDAGADDWRRAAADQFLAGYSESDQIYDAV